MPGLAGARGLTPLAPRVVGEGDVLEAHVAADRTERGRAGAVLEGGRGVEQLEDLLERRHPRLVGRVQLGELLDRFEQERERRHERDHGAGGDVAGDRLVAAVQHDQRERDPGEHFHGGEVGGVEPHGHHVGVAVLAVELGERRLVAGLLAEAAHDADARERLLQVGGDRPDRLTGAPEGAGGDEPEPDREPGDERHDAERQQRQPGVEVEQHGDRPEQRQAGLHERHDGVGDEAFQGLHVVGDARDQHPRGAALVEADRLALQVGEDADAQVGERALADEADEVGLQVGHRPHQQRGDEEREHDEHERARVVALDPFVDRDLREQRRRQRGGGADEQRGEHRGDAQPVGAQQLQQAAQVARAALLAGALPIPLLHRRARGRARRAASAAGRCCAPAAERPPPMPPRCRRRQPVLGLTAPLPDRARGSPSSGTRARAGPSRTISR